MKTVSPLEEYLTDVKPAMVIRGLQHGKHIDLSVHNKALQDIDTGDEQQFCTYIQQRIGHLPCVYGGYLEHRNLYRRGDHFQTQTEDRDHHLGMDVWAAAGSPVFAPLEGTVHSFANNTALGDYGPTLILEHAFQEGSFYTLYGHLSVADIQQWQVGKTFLKGERVGHLGRWQENGHWPPHLHFQIMTNMSGYEGDFPGVCMPSSKEKMQELCPDPGLLFGL